MMLKHKWIGYFKILRCFNHNRPFFYLPKIIKDSIGNHHDVSFILLIILICHLFLTELMHVPEHL